MNQEDIIRMAREAGLYVGRNVSGVQLVGSSYEEGGLLVHLTVEEFERFAALVAEHEREACARVCDAPTPLQDCRGRLDKLKEASKLMLEELETYHQQYPGMAKGYVLDAMAGLKDAIKRAEA